MFQAPSQREIEDRYIGDTWIFPYTIYNPPVVTTTPPTTPTVPAEPANARYNADRLHIYQPEPVAVEVISAHGTACDLTGYQATGYLIVANGAPQLLATAPQADDNLLANRQFKLIVPATITRTLHADAFGQQQAPTRVQVVLIDPAGNNVTIDRVPIRVMAP